MAGYIGDIPVPQATQTRQTFTATASQTSFPTIGYTAGFIDVYLNGVKILDGVDYTATNGSDVVLTTGAALNDILEVTIFDTFTTSSGTTTNTTHTSATLKSNVTLKNDTEEDSDGGRASKIIYQGEQSGGEITTLAEIQASHDGSSDDQKADLILRTNDGSDGTSPTERLRVDSTGNVNVSGSTKTTALSSLAHFDTLGLTVDDNTAYDNVGIGGGIAFRAKRNTSGTQTIFGAIDVGKESTANDSYTGSLRFYTNNNSTGVPTEGARLDSALKFRVGGSTATISNSLTVEGSSYTLFGMKRNTGVTTGTGEFAMHMETNSQTTISYDDEGSVVFGTAATPSTAAGFSEKMRINNNGNVMIGTTTDGGHAFHIAKAHANDFVAEINNSSGTNPYVLHLATTGAAPDDGNRYFIYANDSSTLRFAVTNQGDVQNHDNSYGAISDQRVKDDISDATSQWDDIKGLKVRKFKLKDDIRAYGDDAKFRLGLISQETEAVSPNLITENEASPNNILSSSEFGTLYEDGDDIPDGKEVGDVKERKATVKGIKYSILYMKAVKALQEAMARIETLETKVAALEAE
ncbi:MAG: hypothetical protein CM1200mV1_220 [uncultured marine virus]|nr:MAG: hypothetical protein CM1200mV1_220 [uncultured marine virus]